MASRKIIFLIVVGVLLIALILGIVSVANKQQTQQSNKVANLSIWVVGGTTEDYMKVFAGFNAISPSYKDTVLDIRVFPNYANYRDILLSTLAEGKGPDIFMVEGQGDEILAKKAVAIPEPFVNLADFEKRFDDIFLPLLVTEGEDDNVLRSLLGAPLGYETLGVFYNKNYFPTVPKTWNELGLLYLNGKRFFPVNIGLGPRYTPDATDIISLFLVSNGVKGSENLSTAGLGLEEYLKYGTTPLRSTNITTSPNDEINLEETSETLVDTTENIIESPTENMSLISKKAEYDETGFSTIDSFMRGEIGMVVGFPSTIREIEKSHKRAGSDATTGLILTERLPQNSLGKGSINIARYKYLALSSKSANPEAGAAFIQYLINPTTLAALTEAFPYLISPDRSMHEYQGQKILSTLFARARLDSFIPEVGETVHVFNYRLKDEFEKNYEDFLDRNDKIDINNLLSRISDAVACKVDSTAGGVLSERCLK